MNQIQHIKRINEQELESGSSASWHDQYKDSAYINVGGLPYNLTEGDVITIFSQYGEIADINMPRDPQTGKPRGFAWLMYMDQRSTVLAVDNLNGAQVLGRTLRVDHVLDYKQLERDQETGKMKEREERSLAAHPEKFLARGSDAGSDAESDDSHPSIDLDDPMRDYLIEQKRAAKKRRIESGGGESKEERKRRREEKRREKEAKRAEREKKRAGKKGIEGSAGGKERDEGMRDKRGPDDRALLSRRDDNRKREYSPRRGEERDRRRDYSPRRGDRERDYDRRRGDDYDDRRRRDDGDRDRERDYPRRDDERDYRRGSSSGRGSGGDAFADLEKWVKG
ncbi:hypothetical protein JCM11251_000073 [Rhodosporidiobolus azoricus]